MGEYNPYLDPIGFEEERQRLWRLYHQYSRPSDHNYRISLIRKIAALHGGYAKLPRLSERQKTILEMYYERNVSNASIGMRIGEREATIRKEHDAALHLLERFADESAPEHRVIPIHEPRAASTRQPPASHTSFVMPASVQDFWQRYDNETRWQCKREMMRAYVKAFPLKDMSFVEQERMVVEKLVIEGLDVSSVMQTEGISKQTVHNHFNKAIDTLRIRDGVAPLHLKPAQPEKRAASRASVPRARAKKEKSELEGEKLLTEFLADRGNKKLKDKLVLAWIPLVHYVLQKKAHLDLAKFEYEDYVSIGTIGLLEAIKKYDPSHEGGASFKTYATNRILFAVQNGTKDELGTRNAITRAAGISNEIKEIDKLEKMGNLDALMSSRKSELQLRLENIRLAIQVDSLDRPIGYQHNGNPVFLGDLVTHPESTEEYADTTMQIEALSEHIRILSKREQEILYYCLYEDMTSTMIGKKYGMSRKAIEDRIDTALAKLKRAFLSSDGEGYTTQKKILGRYDSDSKEFQSALALLPSKHMKVLYLREVEGLTLEAIGRRMSLTRERVRQIAVQATANLIRYLEISNDPV